LNLGTLIKQIAQLPLFYLEQKQIKLDHERKESSRQQKMVQMKNKKDLLQIYPARASSYSGVHPIHMIDTVRQCESEDCGILLSRGRPCNELFLTVGTFESMSA
jgi:hypothetical protein